MSVSIYISISVIDFFFLYVKHKGGRKSLKERIYCREAGRLDGLPRLAGMRYKIEQIHAHTQQEVESMVNVPYHATPRTLLYCIGIFLSSIGNACYGNANKEKLWRTVRMSNVSCDY